MLSLRCARWALGLAIAAAAVACGDSLSTAPTTGQNARLIAHFDSLSATSPPDHAFQLTDIVTELADGAPVGHLTLEVNSGTATYSVVARYDIVDLAGAPMDSDLIVLAWRGDDADTIVSIEYEHDSVFAQLTTPDSTFSGVIAGAATPGELHGTCASFVADLPPGIFIPPALSCQFERISAVATGTLRDTSGTAVDFSLVSQPIAAIRYEFNEQVP